MPTAASSSNVFIVVPVELGRELLEAGDVEPLFRKDRDDTALLPALIVAASSAVVTVVATDLSYVARKAIAQKISSWAARRRRGGLTMPELKSQRVGWKTTKSITISQTLSVETIETILSEEISSLAQDNAGDETSDSQN